eukprot:3667598-Prymnesium_polylepis.1
MPACPARLAEVCERAPLSAKRIVPLHGGKGEGGGRVRPAVAAADGVEPASSPVLSQRELRRLPPRGAHARGA